MVNDGQSPGIQQLLLAVLRGPLMVNIPKYTMGEQYVDFAPVTNALAAYRDQGNRDRAFAQGERQFGAQNALAQAQLGIQQQAAARAAQMHPLQLRQMETQIEAARRQGFTEAQIAPLKMDLMRAQTEQARALASSAVRKDELNSALGGMIQGMLPKPGGAPMPPNAMPQQPGGFQPQSFDGGGSDPMLIPTQVGGGQPMQQPQQVAPDMVNTPAGPMTIENAQRMGFALSLAGKGDAGKVLLESANSNRLNDAARNEVEKDIVGMTNTLGRLESLKNRFDPKFLTIPNRADMAVRSLVERLSNKPDSALTTEEREKKAELSRYTKFRQTSINNAALYVKYLSGVAVSEAEFNRIMKTLPNAGSGILDGDSPTEYQAKLQESITQSKMAVARAIHLRRQGFAGKPWEAGIALDDMRGVIDQRASEIEQQLQGRVPPDQMRGVVRQRLKQEFGI
jgi:hypothetical protein